MNPLTAAVVGCGDIAHAHVTGYRRCGVQVVAVADPLPAARAQFAAEYGIPHTHDDLESLLAAVRPDIVSICTWHLLHAPLTVRSARAGVAAVVCEKPMAVGLDEADRMIQGCAAAGTRLVVSHQRRFTPGWEKGRQLVADGALGQVLMATAKFGQGLLNCGTHAIDGVRFILGDPDTEWVMGALERRTDRYERDTPIEDACMGLVHFAGGAQLFLQCDLDLRGAGFEFFVRGTEGVMEVSETRCRTLGSGQGGWVDHDLGVPPEAIDTIGGVANARQTRELLDWLAGRTSGHRCAGQVARATVEIMMALQESARRHQVVTMPLTETGYPLQRMIAEGKLPVEEPGRYDIRAFLRCDAVDETAYAELRASGMGHHQIMRTLWERRQQEAPG